jgi:hypothetical protein
LLKGGFEIARFRSLRGRNLAISFLGFPFLAKHDSVGASEGERCDRRSPRPRDQAICSERGWTRSLSFGMQDFDPSISKATYYRRKAREARGETSPNGAKIGEILVSSDLSHDHPLDQAAESGRPKRPAPGTA